MHACGNNRDAERLRQVVHHLEFEKIPWNQQTYAKLIFAYLQCAEFDRALYWYHQFKLFSTSVLPFSEFMKLLLFGLKFNRVHELKELYTDLSLYNDIDVKDGFELLRALVDANQFEYAKECYAKLTTSMEGPSQHYVDMGLLNQFLELAGRKGDSTFVSDLLVHMCSTPYLPISLHHCACLLQALSFRHDYISLFQLLPSIRSLGHSPHESLHQLLPPFPSTSKWYGCQQWVSSQTSVDPSTWTVLIQGAFELGLHAQGLDLFSSLCTSVGLLRLELPTCHAALLCTQGQPPASRQHIFKTMLHHQRSFSTTTYLLLIDLATTLVEAWERYQFAKQQLQLHPCHGSTLMPPLFETMVTHYFKDPPLHSMEEMDRYWQELCMDFEVYGENTSLSLELKTLLASKDYHRVVEHQRVLETTHPPKKKEERLLLKKWSHAKDLFQFHPILHDSQSRLVREV
ncbi:hypothetical protein HMI54_008777 [Coelomomyces lativittatus]|nr:hypothetical protein HMI54_008777 [Coelomomyces lativittatus]